MANGYFERGEMYDILFGDALSGELTAHRPGIIVSCEQGNSTSPTVLVVYTTTTTTGRDKSVNHEFVMNGWKNYALCNQIASVNKNRLKKFFGKLSDGDMRAIDGCLEVALDLGYVDDTALKEKDREISDRDALIAEKDKEIAELKARVAAEVAKTENLELSYKVENAMWQKLYEKALNQVVDMKYTNDLFLKNHLGREETPKAPVVKTPEPPVVNNPPAEPPKSPEPEVEDTRLDINSCTITALKNVGFSLAVARQITTRRPYKSVADLKSVPGLKASLFRVMEPKLRCVPVEEAPEQEKKPPVVSEPDPGYEVDPPVIPEETDEPEVKKINVNTASAKEIAEFLGISENAGMAIVGKRKREGLFTSLEQIVHPKRFTAKALEKYRDKLTI